MAPGQNADELFRAGWEAHRAGDLHAAAELYRRVLATDPRHADAIYLLGVAAHQIGNFAAAAELAARALAIAPERAEFHNLRGMALASLGDDAAAEPCYRKAVAAGGDEEVYNNLGVLLKKQGRIDEAMAAYRGALERNPSYADAWYNLGNAQRVQGHLDAAADCLRRAVEAQPGHAHALAALGQVLRQSKRSAEALPFLDRAVALAPADAGLHCDRGDVLQDLGRLGEAAECYRQAATLDRGLARAWYSAGCVETARGEDAAALACLRDAVAAAPGWAEALHNLGQMLFKLGQADEAAERLRAAARRTSIELPALSLAVMIPGSPGSGNREILDARRSWAEAFLPPPRPAERFAARSAPRGRKLRIGYLSSHFHQTNYMKPVCALINAHDRGAFEIHLFSDSPENTLGPGFRRQPEDRFHFIGDYIGGMSNEDAADQIEREGIDVLVDLNGFSATRRLPLVALHPAPVVAAWFNLYATSGMRGYDYLIGDAHVIPPAEEPFYSEKIVRLPGSCLAFSIDYPVPGTAPPPCLVRGAISFGCLAPQYKITPQVIEAWSAILREAPGSTMLLRNRVLANEGNRDFVRGEFAAHGIEARRLRLEGPLPHLEYLKTYDEIDLALDTFPYNGGTTTTEAIWQGVPVIAFRGDRWVARTSASILREGGLGEFVAADRDGYVRRAVELARDPETPARLARLRGEMRERVRRSPVCDTEGLARAMERFYWMATNEQV